MKATLTSRDGITIDRTLDDVPPQTAEITVNEHRVTPEGEDLGTTAVVYDLVTVMKDADGGIIDSLFTRRV